MTIVSRDVSARGIRTRVIQSGSGSPVVLIHGFLSNLHTFDDVRDPLGDHFHLTAIDLPGAGQSERPTPNRFDYSIVSFAEVVTDIIAALQIGRCHVIGHGLGAAIALTLASEHPEFVDHLTLVCPEIYPGRPTPLARIMRIPIIGGFLFKQIVGRTLFRSLFLKHNYAPGHVLSQQRMNDYFEPLTEPASRESAFSMLRACSDMRPCIARLSRIKSPTLVVWGRADRRLHGEYAPRIVRQISNARLEYIDSGHCPQEEQPKAFVASMLQFLPAKTP